MVPSSPVFITGHSLLFKQFDTSSVNSALANVTSYPDLIQDWYEVHYLAVCSGMWNAHTVSAGKNQSTITCTPQTGGYTFVLVQEILLNDPFLPLLVDSPYGTLDTKAPLILFTIGFSFTALSLLGYLYSLLFTMATPKAKISLGLLRVACLLNIPAFIFLMISSAEITVLARKLVGTGDIGLGLVHTSIDKGFYVSAWLAAAFMFVALGIGVVKAFILVRVQQSRESNTRDGQNTVEESIQSRIPEQKVSIIQ